MAHHAKTPRSVLDAPSPTVTIVSPQLGANRTERRHGIARPPGMNVMQYAAYLRRVKNLGRNTPHEVTR